jgi:hypothetical protein
LWRSGICFWFFTCTDAKRAKVAFEREDTAWLS